MLGLANWMLLVVSNLQNRHESDSNLNLCKKVINKILLLEGCENELYWFSLYCRSPGWLGKPSNLSQAASGGTRDAPNQHICCISHGTVSHINSSLVPLAMPDSQVALPPRPFVSL